MVDWTKARHWEFLQPWFVVLRGRLSPHRERGHPVRVGVDVKDWWIQVRLQDISTDLDKLRAVREALLIVGAFAQLNRDCCMQYLQTFSLFQPATYMLVDEPTFLPRFDVADLVGGRDDWEYHHQRPRGEAVGRVNGAQVNAALDAFFAVGDVSVPFVETWARVLDMQDRVGRTAVRLESVELLVNLRASRTRPQVFVQCLRALHDAIKTTQDIAREREWVPRAEAVLLEPSFAVTVMNLNLTHSPMDCEEVRALRDLVDLGVPVNRVRLPRLPAQPSVSHDDPTWLWMWAELLRSLMGCAGLEQGAVKTKRVRRLEVPAGYNKEPFRSALFSTLVGTISVSEIRLHGEAEDDDNSVTVLDETTWQWIAWMVSHETGQPQHSIDSLSLVQTWIDRTFVDLLDPSKRQHAPMEAYLKSHVQGVDFDASASHRLGPTVMIPAGTELTIHYSAGSVKNCVTEGIVSGIVIQGEDDPLNSILLVRGVGICSLPSAALPSKRARVDITATQVHGNERCSLVNLRIRYSEGISRVKHPLMRLVELFGASLRGLNVDVPRLNNTMLAAFLKACPVLENLSFGETEYDTLAWLFTAYSRGCKISSLSVKMRHENGLLRLAERLKSPTELVSQRLSRLAIPQNSLLASFSAMLGANKSLTHFQHGYGYGHSYGFCYNDDPDVTRFINRHHNEQLQHATPRPLTLRQRLAFLSAVRARSLASETSTWGDRVTSLILDFAAELPRRYVYSLGYTPRGQAIYRPIRLPPPVSIKVEQRGSHMVH